MGRARNPKRDEAFRLFEAARGEVKMKDLAEQLDLPASRVRKWKTEDKWDEKLEERSGRKKGALPLRKKRGEKKKNKGGAPLHNTNAVKTGEFQTLWLDQLSDAERQAYEEISVDKEGQADHDIRLLTWRENKMMERLFALREGIDNIERDTVEEAVPKVVPIQAYDEAAGAVVSKSSATRELQVKEVRTKVKSLLDEILRVEEALTRIQDKKAKFLQTKHKIEIDRERLELERRRIEILAEQCGIGNTRTDELQVTVAYE